MAKLVDYTGAGTRLEPAQAFALDPTRWAFQPKHDGCYARVSLDNTGRISSVVSRNGQPLREASDLIGILAGPPDGVLHGELDAHTEAGNAIATKRGWRNLTLFDVTKHDGRDISRLPYDQRYQLLHRTQVEIEMAGRNNPWFRDDDGNAHDLKSGRFVAQVPRDIRRLPVVPIARGRGAGERLWSEFVEQHQGEGLVAVRLDAPAGLRGAKRKVKVIDTMDATVMTTDARAMVVEADGFRFAMSNVGQRYELGMVLEIAHDGTYADGVTPRFPRVVRVREDLWGN